MAETTKKCPMCAEQIPLAATLCEYCGAQFELTITGYCQNCHQVREADENGCCKVCNREIIDRRIESKLIEEPAHKPLPTSQPIPQSEITRTGKGRLPIGILAGILIFASGFAFVWFGRNSIPAASSFFATDTPIVTTTLTPTAAPTATPTRTPRPTPTATPRPAWVADFAQPIIDAIANRSPDFQDDFSRTPTIWKLGEQGEISNESLVYNTKQDSGFISIPCCLNYQNIVFNVDVNINELRGENTAEFKWSEDFVFELKHDGRWFISSWQNNTRHDLGNGRQQIPNPEKVTLMLISNVSKYAIYINNTPVSYGNYGTEKFKPRIGLRGWTDGNTAVIVRYDDIKIWSLDGIPNLP